MQTSKLAVQSKWHFSRGALALALTALGISSAARADDDYGCRVVICLANPASNGGPRAPDTCAPAIDRLYDDLRHGRGFPQCSGSGMTVRQDNTPYDPCPSGTTAAAAGTWVVQGTLRSKPTYWSDSGDFILNGAPRPSVSSTTDGFAGYGALACVGQQVGSYQVYGDPSAPVGSGQWGNRWDGGDGGDGDPVTVNVYSQILWQQPQSPNAIDIYTGGQFQTRIHY